MPRSSQMSSHAEMGLDDMLTMLVHKALEDGAAEIARAQGATGRVVVSLELHLVKGKPRWQSATVHFAQHHQYSKEA